MRTHPEPPRRKVALWLAVASLVGAIIAQYNKNPLLEFSLLAFGIGSLIVSGEVNEKRVTARLDAYAKDQLEVQHQIANAIDDYVLRHAASSPLIESKLYDSICELGERVARQHAFGRVPVNENVSADHRITAWRAEQLPNTKPTEVTWFTFEIDRRWSIAPVRGRGPVIQTPDQVVPRIVVVGHSTNVVLSQFRNAGTSVYFPVPPQVREYPLLDDAFREVVFLQPIDGDDLVIEVTRQPALDAAPPRRIRMMPTYRTASAERQQEIVRRLLGPEATDDDIADGLKNVYEVYEPSLDNAKSVTIDTSAEASHWDFRFRFRYVLPVKIVVDGEYLWDQTSFINTFDHVSNVKRITFAPEIPGVRVTRSLQPNIGRQFFDRVADCDLHQMSRWEVIGRGDAYWYPGEFLTFRWSDDFSERAQHRANGVEVDQEGSGAATTAAAESRESP